MGSAQSYPGLTQDVLEDYASLTYLSKGEILYLMKKFYSIDPEMIKNNYHHRFNREDIVNKFCVLKKKLKKTFPAGVTFFQQENSKRMNGARNKNNPFQDRIFRVFSSKQDDCFSFEDMVDLCSAFSATCPAEVKAAWAFRIFDLDEDGQITEKDISQIVDRLTWKVISNRIIADNNHIDRDSKVKIAKVILDEISLDRSGGIGINEFKLIMARLPEFPTSFYFRL